MVTCSLSPSVLGKEKKINFKILRGLNCLKTPGLLFGKGIVSLEVGNLWLNLSEILVVLLKTKLLESLGREGCGYMNMEDYTESESVIQQEHISNGQSSQQHTMCQVICFLSPSSRELYSTSPSGQ